MLFTVKRFTVREVRENFNLPEDFVFSKLHPLPAIDSLFCISSDKAARSTALCTKYIGNPKYCPQSSQQHSIRISLITYFPVIFLSPHNPLLHGHYAMYSMELQPGPTLRRHELSARFLSNTFRRHRRSQISRIICTRVKFLISQISFTHPLKQGERISPSVNVSFRWGSAINYYMLLRLLHPNNRNYSWHPIWEGITRKSPYPLFIGKCYSAVVVINVYPARAASAALRLTCSCSSSK